MKLSSDIVLYMDNIFTNPLITITQSTPFRFIREILHFIKNFSESSGSIPNYFEEHVNLEHLM